MTKSHFKRFPRMLEAAEGQACVNCGVRDDTVVAAHYTGMRAQLFGKGVAEKGNDLFVADLCRRCHTAFDKSEGSYVSDPYLRKIDLSERFLFCIMQTLLRRVEQNVLIVSGDRHNDPDHHPENGITPDRGTDGGAGQ